MSSNAADTARAIVERIAHDLSVRDPMLQALGGYRRDKLPPLIDEWTALVVPVIEEALLTNVHPHDVIERLVAAERRAEELQSEKDSLTAAYCVTVEARDAAEKERDELRQTSGDLCSRCGWRGITPPEGCAFCGVFELRAAAKELRAERDEANAKVKQAYQEFFEWQYAYVERKPLPNGEYAHLGICSGSRRVPAGAPGCVCDPGYKELKAEVERLESDLDRKFQHHDQAERECSRLSRRVQELEAGVRSFVSAFESDFVLEDGTIVDEPERMWSPIVRLYQEARALLSPPPAPRPSEPKEEA